MGFSLSFNLIINPASRNFLSIGLAELQNSAKRARLLCRQTSIVLVRGWARFHTVKTLAICSCDLCNSSWLCQPTDVAIYSTEK